MLDWADDFFYTSGKLSVQCYKEELEAAARTKRLAGYQILDIQDFSGQGTALVGILDAFMDNKGHVQDSVRTVSYLHNSNPISIQMEKPLTLPWHCVIITLKS
jgi:hypothetical protein